LAAAGLILALLVLVSWWLVRRRRRRRAGASLPATSLAHAAPDSPRHRLIARAEQLRGILVARFGPAWSARTTEEVVAEADLAQRLGAERMDRLARLLRAADRAKFSDEEAVGSDGAIPDPYSLEPEDWDAWVVDFESALAAGATSRSNGK
jgi:hypothetical protein